MVQRQHQQQRRQQATKAAENNENDGNYLLQRLQATFWMTSAKVQYRIESEINSWVGTQSHVGVSIYVCVCVLKCKGKCGSSVYEEWG